MDDEHVTVSVRNLGGIDSTALSVGPGVTALTGRNATNRTSLLRALAAALGGSAGELKADADEGRVELTVDGDTYTRRFERGPTRGSDDSVAHSANNGRVTAAGDPYTDDAAAVDLFSCVLATNPVREAAERGDGAALREALMRPVDTEAIRAEVERRRREVRELEDRLADVEREVDRIPDLEAQLASSREEREAVTAELESVREAVAAFEADADAAAAAEAVVADLQEVREEYESVRDRLETQRTALDSLTEERESVAADLAETEAPEDRLADAKDELERLQAERRDHETTVNSLVSIVEFNEEVLASGSLPGAAGDVVDDLDPASRAVECWTCGTTVERGAIEARVDDLREVVEEKRERRNELRTAIADQRETVEDLRSTVREARSLSAELEEIDAEVERREARIEDLEARAADLRERIDELEAEAAETEELRDSEVLERYERLSELEYERGQLDERIESLAADLEGARERREERDGIESDLADQRARLAALRDRIADLERASVETFNEHAAAVIDALGYDNVERVWLERRTEGEAGIVPESTFDLHVVRATPEGSVYEDSVAHLSESEREVVGLVTALAGYLVHDVAETVPFLLLDSLEAIDADRIAALVEYFADHADYLLVALLPEDAQALPDEYDRVVMAEATA